MSLACHHIPALKHIPSVQTMVQFRFTVTVIVIVRECVFDFRYLYDFCCRSCICVYVKSFRLWSFAVFMLKSHKTKTFLKDLLKWCWSVSGDMDGYVFVINNKQRLEDSFCLLFLSHSLRAKERNPQVVWGSEGIRFTVWPLVCI